MLPKSVMLQTKIIATLLFIRCLIILFCGIITAGIEDSLSHLLFNNNCADERGSFAGVKAEKILKKEIEEERK